MSKKTQTTGVPKRRRRRAASTAAIDGDAAQNRADPDYKSRAEREERMQRLAIRAVAGIVAILAVVVAIAFAVEQLFIPNQVLAVVNGENITVRQFREEYNLERARLRMQLNQIQNSGFDLQQLAQQEPYRTWINEVNVPDQLGLRVINDMVDDRLVAQAASVRSITVNDAALEKEIQDFFGFDPTAVALIGVEPSETPEPTITPTPFVSPTPTAIPTITPSPVPGEVDESEGEVDPTVTPQPTVVEPTLSPEDMRENFQENRENYRSFLSINGIADETIDAFFERMALETLLAEDLVGAEGTLLYADARHILLETEAEAESALGALRDGESFADLARAISTDPGSGARGGELGETFVGNYVPEFREAIEEAKIGELVGPVQSEFGYHILQVRSKDERAGDAFSGQLERAQQRELELFVENLREQNADQYQIYESWLNYIPRG
ncbi:MAG: peptidylprolyl isomerase [Chloroflexota bacterium]|nr:peptidylprolyl isomerase [Chloroflexota bacterium]